MGHQGEVGVKVAVQLVSGGDLLIDIAFAEGNVVVFQVPAELKVVRQPVHCHDVAQVEIEPGQLEGVFEGDGVVTG